MNLSIHQQIFTQQIARLIFYANSLGINLTFGEAYRTKEQQAIHLKTGKSKIKYSNHQRRLAVDFNFFINGKLTYEHPIITQLGAYWVSLDSHNRWGGNFTGFYDSPHFERHIIT